MSLAGRWTKTSRTRTRTIFCVAMEQRPKGDVTLAQLVNSAQRLFRGTLYDLSLQAWLRAKLRASAIVGQSSIASSHHTPFSPLIMVPT